MKQLDNFLFTSFAYQGKYNINSNLYWKLRNEIHYELNYLLFYSVQHYLEWELINYETT